METIDEKLDRMFAFFEEHTAIFLPKKPSKKKKAGSKLTSTDYAAQYILNLRKSKSK